MKNKSIVINIDTLPLTERMIIGRKIENEGVLETEDNVKASQSNKAQVIYSAKRRPKSTLIGCNLYLEQYKGSVIKKTNVCSVKQKNKFKGIEKKESKNKGLKLIHCKTSCRIPKLRVADIELIQQLTKVMEEIGSRNEIHKKLGFKTQQVELISSKSNAQSKNKLIQTKPQSIKHQFSKPNLQPLRICRAKQLKIAIPKAKHMKINTKHSSLLKRLVINTSKSKEQLKSKGSKWYRGKSNSVKRSAGCTLTVLEPVNLLIDTRVASLSIPNTARK